MNLTCNLRGHDYEEYKEEKTYRYRGYSHYCSRCENPTDSPNVDKWDNTFWESTEWQVLKIVSAYVLGTFAVILLIFWLAVFASKSTCNSYAEMGIDVQWNFWTSCMANHPKFGWVPVAEYFKILNVNLP